jgi:putative ABC transport system permease protein
VTGNIEESIFMPFSTMQRAFNQGDVIHFLGCTAKPGYPASVTEDEVKSIIKATHEISPTDEKALRSFNIEKEFKIFQNLFLGVDFLIWIVGLGALLSGIIGISNIMLVTVRERTREIGVRRALGARPFTIVKQILSESFLLTAVAGFGGFFVGVVILEIVRAAMLANTQVPDGGGSFFIPPFVSFETGLVAMAVLVVSGVVAGLMPAMRALKIKAIDAIREE